MQKHQTQNHIESVLRKRFSRVQIVESRSNSVEERLLLNSNNLVEVLRFFRSDADTQLDTLVDISAIHHLNKASCVFESPNVFPFFEVYYLLRSSKLKYNLRISIEVSQDLPSVPSVVPVFRGANWLEREMYDMFGIFVEGHPFLRRLIMYPTFDGHPLVKDYPLEREQFLVLLEEK